MGPRATCPPGGVTAAAPAVVRLAPPLLLSEPGTMPSSVVLLGLGVGASSPILSRGLHRKDGGAKLTVIQGPVQSRMTVDTAPQQVNHR